MSSVVGAVGALAGVGLGMTWARGTAWVAMRWLRAGGLGRGYGAVRVERGEMRTAGRGLVWMG